jgi:hypothetical protein
MLMTDLGASAARGVRYDRLAQEISGRFGSSPILSLILLFHAQQDSNSGKTTPSLYNEGLMAD